MSWRTIRWAIPLDERPTILHLGVGIHGREPISRYPGFDCWCVHLYRYSAEVWLDGQMFPIEPGYAGIIPPQTQIEYRLRGRSLHTYAHVALPAAPAMDVPIAAMQDLGSDFEDLYSTFEGAIGCYATRPRWAEVRLWDILWQLADRTSASSPGPPGPHPAVQKALQIIELRLGEHIRVAELAREVALSHNQLTRLFRSAVGTTVVDYIRTRRVERARHLLVHSSLPIKAIAAEVGISDLHLFNKTVRRTLGASPRQVRAHLSNRP